MIVGIQLRTFILDLTISFSEVIARSLAKLSDVTLALSSEQSYVIHAISARRLSLADP